MIQTCWSPWGLSSSITTAMPNTLSPVLFVLCQVNTTIIVFSQFACKDNSRIRSNTHWNVHFLLNFWIRINVYDCMLYFILKCATVISDCTLCVLPSLSLCVFLVIHDTYTLFTHAAGRIPGKLFTFELLTFKLCFPRQPFCQLYPVPFQHPFPSLSALISG